MASRRERDGALDALYAELPAMTCKGECADSCGPIDMTQAEAARIEERRGMPIGECSGNSVKGLTCPMLSQSGWCMVYSVRPAICRLWGVIDVLACPRGCVPEGGHWPAERGFEWLLRVHSAVGESPDESVSTRPEWFANLQRQALQRHLERGGTIDGWLRVHRPR